MAKPLLGHGAVWAQIMAMELRNPGWNEALGTLQLLFTDGKPSLLGLRLGKASVAIRSLSWISKDTGMKDCGLFPGTSKLK